MEQQLERAAEKLVRSVKALEKKTGAYSFNYYQGKLRALVGSEAFKQISQGQDTQLIKSSLPDYPWKTETNIGGITFVALLDKEPDRGGIKT